MLTRILTGLSAAAILLAAAPAVAQTHDLGGFTPERMRAHMSFLADDLLEGRGTGTRGFDVAALYVQTQFQGLGLTPAGNADGTSWRQPVGFTSTVVTSGGVGWTPTGGQTVTWANGTEAVMIPIGAGGNTVTAPAVFVGYGIHAPDHGFDDYAGLDLTGKIAVMLVDAPEGTDESVSEGKPVAAFMRGAVGIVLINSLASERDLPWVDVADYLTQPQMSLRNPDEEPATGPGPLIAALNSTAAEVMFAGAPKSATDILAEADTPEGKPAGFDLPGQITLSIDNQVSQIDSTNVVGLLPGSDPMLRDEYIVVMAHLDHEGISPDETKPDRIYNGAMDNSAGTAAMLEVARALTSGPTPPRRSVIFIALTGEEKGLLGSEYFAANPTVPKDRMVAGVNMDMPLLTYAFTDIVVLGSEHSTLGQTADAVAASLGLVNSPDPLPEEGFFMRSDHFSFVQAGVPAIDISTGHANGGAAVWETFLETIYHKPNDDLTQPIDWNAAARFAQVSAGVVRAVADADQRPLWYAGDRFGDEFAPDAEKAPKPAE